MTNLENKIYFRDWNQYRTVQSKNSSRYNDRTTCLKISHIINISE